VSDLLQPSKNVVIGPLTSKRRGIVEMRGNILVSNENLERADNLCQRNGLIGLPLLCSFCVVNEDDEVVVLSLVVDLGLGCFAFSHDC
jgi:hypothetical protein